MATESGADNAKKEKKPNFLIRFVRWFKSAGLELRKTTWPKGREVFKKLGTVLIVVLFFFLILMGMDAALGQAYKGLITGFPAPAPVDGGAAAGALMSIFRTGL